jgi:hypothetical protein
MIGERKRCFVNFICKCDKDTTRIVEKMYWDTIGRNATCNKCTYQKRVETYRQNHPEKVKIPIEKIPDDIRKKLSVEKAKQTCLERFGVDNIFKSPVFLEKIRQTCLDKYGVEYPSQLPDILEKKKKTMMDKYGVEYPMQHAESRIKNLKNSFINKTFTSPDGKIFNYQGYEDATIKKLLSDGYESSDIWYEEEITSNEDIPKFMYQYEGTTHRYYPDLMLWSESRFIEVKSEYTYEVDKNRVHVKANCVKSYGFDMEIWIYNKKKELVDIINV